MATQVADNGVSFIGVLAERQFKPGQRYVQLVFETADGIKISLSRNIKLIRSLRVGTTYKIRGVERKLGAKRFIAEPIAIPMPYDLRLSHRRRLRLFAGVAACVVAAAAYYLAFIPAATPLEISAVSNHSTVSAGARSTTPVTTPVKPTTSTPTLASSTKQTTTVKRSAVTAPAATSSQSATPAATSTTPPATVPANTIPSTTDPTTTTMPDPTTTDPTTQPPTTTPDPTTPPIDTPPATN